MRRLLIVLFILPVAAWVGHASLVFNDQATWLAAVTGVTTINFEGLAPTGNFLFVGSGAGATTTVSGVTFAVGPASNGNLFILGDDYYYPGTSAIASQASTTPFNDLLITLPSPVIALGFDFGDFGGDTATIRLSTGEIEQPAAIAAPYVGFFGVISPGPITSVDITTPNSTMNVADLSVAVGAVPEPNAFIPLLIIVTLMALSFSAKRLRKGR